MIISIIFMMMLMIIAIMIVMVMLNCDIAFELIVMLSVLTSMNIL